MTTTDMILNQIYFFKYFILTLPIKMWHKYFVHKENVKCQQIAQIELHFYLE